MSRTKKKSALNFEASIQKLEAIVSRLEDEQVSLEESLELFAEGRSLAKACEKELAEAEIKIRKLIEDESGEVSEVPVEFESSSDDEEDEETLPGDQ